jgi:hypothetical protein
MSSRARSQRSGGEWFCDGRHSSSAALGLCRQTSVRHRHSGRENVDRHWGFPFTGMEELSFKRVPGRMDLPGTEPLAFRFGTILSGERGTKVRARRPPSAHVALSVAGDCRGRGCRRTAGGLGARWRASLRLAGEQPRRLYGMLLRQQLAEGAVERGAQRGKTLPDVRE